MADLCFLNFFIDMAFGTTFELRKLTYSNSEKFRTVKFWDKLWVRKFNRPKFLPSEIFTCPKILLTTKSDEERKERWRFDSIYAFLMFYLSEILSEIENFASEIKRPKILRLEFLGVNVFFCIGVLIWAKCGRVV